MLFILYPAPPWLGHVCAGGNRGVVDEREAEPAVDVASEASAQQPSDFLQPCADLHASAQRVSEGMHAY